MMALCGTGFPASLVEGKPMLHRNMKRSPHHVGPALAHSTQGPASADGSEGSRGGPPGGFVIVFILIKNVSGQSLAAGWNLRKV